MDPEIEPRVRGFRVLTIGSGRTCEEVRRALDERRFGVAGRLAAAPESASDLRRAVLGAELVVFCGDQGERPLTFTRIDHACAAHNRPCLHVAIERGAITVGPLFIPRRTACFRCSRLYLSCFDDGGARPSTPAPWMSALAAAAVVDEIAAFVDHGASMRVASCIAIEPYERDQRHRNAVTASYTPTLTACTVCGAADRVSDADARTARRGAAFIVGSRHSGTRLLGLALGAHEAIESLDEDRAYAAVAEQPSDGHRMRLYTLPGWTGALSTFIGHFPGGAYLFMKRPTVQVVASMLTLRGTATTSWAELFAAIEARVAMAAFADPHARDVLERHYRRAAGDTLLMATMCAVARQALVAEYRRSRLRVLDVDHEQLVADPRTALSGVLDFIGLPWSDRVLDGHRIGGGTTIGHSVPTGAPSGVLGSEAITRIRSFEQSLLGELAPG
jgi:hypothetical protein